MKNVGSSFRHELKKSALQAAIEHYELDPKYYEGNPSDFIMANGGDSRVKAAVEKALKDSAYLDGPVTPMVSFKIIPSL